MRGYCVIWSNDIEEYHGKVAAIKRALEISKLYDEEVMVHEFNDDWPNGCMSEGEPIYVEVQK